MGPNPLLRIETGEADAAQDTIPKPDVDLTVGGK
jgi:hypothetical protein